MGRGRSGFESRPDLGAPTMTTKRLTPGGVESSPTANNTNMMNTTFPCGPPNHSHALQAGGVREVISDTLSETVGCPGGDSENGLGVARAAGCFVDEGAKAQAVAVVDAISIRRPVGRMILMNIQLVSSMQQSLAFRVYRSFLYVQRWQRQRDARQRDWMTRMRTATTSAHGWGVYYGYPTCCTDSFAMFQNDHRLRSIEQVMVARGGLVPCSTHAEQILNGEIHIADLIKDRICKRRFGPRTTDGPLSRKAWEERIKIWRSYNRECTEGTNQTSTVKLIKN